ncbi:uncharacterized protein LOC121510246 [Cheilinus undulatus]|uniref:uncharacterized protein LOC121510246 n=1 Tax=Cheilinus undulatus TaxID=241271 RepID=UPI001BD447D5|nr:uncharacterized protein LOC121510246 [Cheilinus undulatus]
MNCRAGFLKVVCVWLLTVTSSSDAERTPKKYTAGVSCKPVELTALTKALMEASLKSFDEANGKHLGTWSPGFPELHVDENSTILGPTVQCSLLFMSQGLKDILQDQRSNLNPTDVSLHKELRKTIASVDMLAVCMKEVIGGECPSTPSPPNMPRHVFERKQWSHTLLKRARGYLDWVENNIPTNETKSKRKYVVNNATVKGKDKIKSRLTQATSRKYLEGSGYFL